LENRSNGGGPVPLAFRAKPFELRHFHSCSDKNKRGRERPRYSRPGGRRYD
jgi:hypothetical protein